ncbi:hypothetical protein H7U33_01860 [Collinsella intestinalis]|nr:hypothetical protein [Collinsella intestinalis]
MLDSADDEHEAHAHRAMLYYASISVRFPQPFEDRAESFADRQEELEDKLIPMLRTAGERPALQWLMETAEHFIETRVPPRTEAEREHLDRFAAGDYRLGLLFPDEQTATTTKQNPAALWKLQNLRRMKG